MGPSSINNLPTTCAQNLLRVQGLSKTSQVLSINWAQQEGSGDFSEPKSENSPQVFSFLLSHSNELRNLTGPIQ